MSSPAETLDPSSPHNPAMDIPTPSSQNSKNSPSKANNDQGKDQHKEGRPRGSARKGGKPRIPRKPKFILINGPVDFIESPDGLLRISIPVGKARPFGKVQFYGIMHDLKQKSSTCYAVCENDQPYCFDISGRNLPDEQQKETTTINCLLDGAEYEIPDPLELPDKQWIGSLVDKETGVEGELVFSRPIMTDEGGAMGEGAKDLGVMELVFRRFKYKEWRKRERIESSPPALSREVAAPLSSGQDRGEAEALGPSSSAATTNMEIPPDLTLAMADVQHLSAQQQRDLLISASEQAANHWIQPEGKVVNEKHKKSMLGSVTYLRPIQGPEARSPVCDTVGMRGGSKEPGPVTSASDNQPTTSTSAQPHHPTPSPSTTLNKGNTALAPQGVTSEADESDSETESFDAVQDRPNLHSSPSKGKGKSRKKKAQYQWVEKWEWTVHPHDAEKDSPFYSSKIFYSPKELLQANRIVPLTPNLDEDIDLPAAGEDSVSDFEILSIHSSSEDDSDSSGGEDDVGESDEDDVMQDARGMNEEFLSKLKEAKEAKERKKELKRKAEEVLGDDEYDEVAIQRQIRKRLRAEKKKDGNSEARPMDLTEDE